MNNELSRFNRVRYTFYSDILEPLVIEEPANWNDDEKEIIRSDKWFGITKNLSNNLEYYGNAFDYIKTNYDIRGIKMNIRLEKEERNGQTDEWELSYMGYLDGATYKQDKNFIKIKFNESQFFKNIESRMKEKFELERLDDLKGNPIPALAYKNLSLQGREIFRESSFIMKGNYFINSKNTTSHAVYMDLLYSSDENVFAPSINLINTNQIDDLTSDCYSDITDSGPHRFTSAQMFYLEAQQEVTYNIKIKFKYKIKQTSSISTSEYRTKGFVIDKCYYQGGLPLSWWSNERHILATEIINQTDIFFNGQVDDEINITLLEGESLVFSFASSTLFDGGYVYCEFSEFSMIIDTVEEAIITDVNCLRMYDVLDRLFLIITGQQCFQSDLLNGYWRDLLMSNGFKIRKFTDKNITTSLEEVLNCLMAIDDICLIIQNNTVRVEKKVDSFIPQEVIFLGEVDNIEREIVEKEHFSSIEIGYDFDGKYEEVNGLDEYNIKNTYSTCIDTTDNTLKAISKVRADAYGITLAQLKPFEDFPKLDTAYDKENFLFDAKLITGNNYELRHWEDDFDSAPTGIFSPQTAFNLRLSPFNSLLRKGKTISCGLQKFPTEMLKYSSTEGNSQLITLYPERAQIQNNVLAVPYYLPEKITFEKKITLQQFKLIVDNPYYLIKFVNEFGKTEYGFICPGSQGIKPNKEGKFTLIKANY